MGTKVMISPSKYVQGAGALAEIGTQAKHLGNKAFVIGGKRAMATAKDIVEESFKKENIATVFEHFNGECCDPEINRLKKIAEDKGAEFVVAVGGGKAIDTAKSIAAMMSQPVVIVPTIAATDAPCSALAVIYTEDGVFDRYFVLPKNPDLVLVDTSIIAKAPVRFLVSGMGDALATWFEADSCFRSSAKNLPGGSSTATALNLARLCYDILMEYGKAAKLAVEKGVVSPAVEKVVEANTLLSGIGFESSGLAAAHAIHDGFTILEETHSVYHGEKVSFGTLVHIVLEDRSWGQIEEVMDFCAEVGLPMTLKQIGVTDPTPEKIMQVAEKTCEPGMLIHNMPFEVTPQMLADAIFAADAIGANYLMERGIEA